MAYLKTLTAAAFAVAVPTAAALSPAGLAAAATAPTELEAPTTTTTAPPSSYVAPSDGSSGGAVSRHPASDTLVARGTVVGHLDSTGEPPALFGDLRDAGGGERGGTSGGPASGPGSISAGPWCNAQCITEGVAYAHGDDVEIVVKTSVPAQIYVSVLLDEDGDGAHEPGEFHDAETSAGLTTELTWELEDLVPGATYYGMAAATDIYGNTSYGWGTFTMPA